MGKKEITMQDLLNSVNEGTSTTRAAQQANSEQLAEVARAQKSYYDSFIDRLNSHEENMSKGLYHVNETVNQAAAEGIKQTRESERRLSDKIDSIKGKAFGALDWITIFLVTIISGVGGWFFSKCMITHEFAAWVDRTDTIQYVRDAAGNITDITNTTSATTVWPTVILTVVLFAIVGFTVAYAICDSIRAKESD